ncbi:hypothetical protein CF327_g970 [Tilletia walkeri]|uniref:Uncharacterized protein n=1 Tax=Tilletia walkeri TaxID=117179 RepID=A0A8X7N9T8_9BASI|nr:hypothetical protein CF327_g970 [Tilletia walkeri]KAE8268131.1 hypothetical protein A4X09_0g4210 [Tilletia walkeri]
MSGALWCSGCVVARTQPLFKRFLATRAASPVKFAPRYPVPQRRKRIPGEGMVVADPARQRKVSLPRHASSVQRDIWDQQIEVSTKLKRLADQVTAAEVQIKGTEQWNRWISSKDSEGRLGFERGEIIAKMATAEAIRSVVIYNQRIRLAFLAGRRSEAFRLYNLMKKSNISPTATTLSIMFSGLGKLARRSAYELGGDKQLTEQVAGLARDVLQLHINASKLWVAPKDRRLSPNQLADAQKEYADAFQLIEMSNAVLSEASPAMRMAASRQKAAAELEQDFTPLSGAYCDYIILLSRTTRGRPEMVWQVYEALRRGAGRPEGISDFDFMRPFRNKSIFTTMLTGIFLQVSTRDARDQTRLAVQRAGLSRRQVAEKTKMADNARSAVDGGDKNDAEETAADDPTDVPSTPFGQARQLWLDWEETVDEAQHRGISRRDLRELEVDGKALDLFLDFFSKCREEKERAFGTHIENSPITRHLQSQTRHP